MHSVGGWGAVTTGKNLAMTLFELLGWDIKANPKYGSEKKGQPTTYLPVRRAGAHPRQLRIHPRGRGAVARPAGVPAHQRGGRPGQGRRVHHPEQPAGRGRAVGDLPGAGAEVHRRQGHPRVLPGRLQHRPRGSLQPRPATAHAGQRLPGRLLPRLRRDGARRPDRGEPVQGHREPAQRQVRQEGQARGGRQPARGEARLHRDPRDSRRGEDRSARARPPAARPTPACRSCSSALPEGDGGVADIHRFWEQTGNFYTVRQGFRQPGRSLHGHGHDPRRHRRLPRHDRRSASSIRSGSPRTAPPAATATPQCPDSAIPGLVSTVGDVLNTAISSIEMGGRPTRFLRKGSRAVEKKLRGVLEKDGLDVRALLRQAIEDAMHEDPNQGNAAHGGGIPPAGESRSANSSSPPPSPTGPARRRRPKAPAACSPSPSIPTPARAAPCAWTSARTTP